MEITNGTEFYLNNPYIGKNRIQQHHAFASVSKFVIPTSNKS